MKSHLYTWHKREWRAVVLTRLLPLPAIVLTVHLLAATPLWPSPRLLHNVEEAVISGQVAAVLHPQDPPDEVWFIGDSTCLMNVDTRVIGGLNLGTLSYLTLDAYAALLRTGFANTAAAPRAVVLVMHPGTLRRERSEPPYARLLDAALTGRSPHRPETSDRLLWLLGAQAVREAWWSRLRPYPAAGSFAGAYGHTRAIYRHVRRERGNLDHDPEPDVERITRGRPDYRLAPHLEHVARQFRATIPEGTQLYIALTPTPVSQALSETPSRYAALREELGEWLEPATLLNLPVIWPDDHYVDAQHFTPAARARYSSALRAAWSE